MNLVMNLLILRAFAQIRPDTVLYDAAASLRFSGNADSHDLPLLLPGQQLSAHQSGLRRTRAGRMENIVKVYGMLWKLYGRDCGHH